MSYETSSQEINKKILSQTKVGRLNWCKNSFVYVISFHPYLLAWNLENARKCLLTFHFWGVDHRLFAIPKICLKHFAHGTITLCCHWKPNHLRREISFRSFLVHIIYFDEIIDLEIIDGTHKRVHYFDFELEYKMHEDRINTPPIFYKM
jgi:hypothetical protein